MDNPLKDALSPVDIQSVREAQRHLQSLYDELDKVESCGVECNSIRELITQRIAEANAIVEHYGKGKF